MQELVFGMIITDLERLRLKWRDYHGIIAQLTPYKSNIAKRAWFVLVFDVILQWVYRWHNAFILAGDEAQPYMGFISPGQFF